MKLTKSQLQAIIKEEFSRYASEKHRIHDVTRKRLVSMVHEFMGVSMSEAAAIVSDLQSLKARQQKYVPQSPGEEPIQPDPDYEFKGKIPSARE